METKILSPNSVRYRIEMVTGSREVIISLGPCDDVRVQSSFFSDGGVSARPASIYVHEIEGFVQDARSKLNLEQEKYQNESQT